MIDRNPVSEPDAVLTVSARASQRAFLQLCALWFITGLFASVAMCYLPRSRLTFLIPAQVDLDQLFLWGVNLSAVALLVAGWYLVQHLAGLILARWPAIPRGIGATKGTGNIVEASKFVTDSDIVLVLTGPVNRYLNANPQLTDWLQIVSSVLLDQLGVFLLLCSLVCSSFRILLGLGVVLLLHRLCQMLTALPPPVGMIRRNPGFASIFVKRDAGNDLFFSRRTALAAYGAFELARLANGWPIVLAVGIVIVQVITALVFRTNYTINVVTAGFAAIVAASIAANVVF